MCMSIKVRKAVDRGNILSLSEVSLGLAVSTTENAPISYQLLDLEKSLAIHFDPVSTRNLFHSKS